MKCVYGLLSIPVGYSLSVIDVSYNIGHTVWEKYNGFYWWLAEKSV